MDELFVYPFLLKGSLFGAYSTALLVILYAVLSAKSIGGKLGMGLKWVAAGTISYVALFVAFIFLENRSESLLTREQIRIFFLTTSIFGSLLFVSGFVKIYKIGKELKLFY